jgi:aminoglycoside phosphotransferase (APT) family kinase protein
LLRTTSNPGIRPDAVEKWFATHVEGATPPLTYELIAGGESNFTFRVTDATDGEYVLRRPPEGELLATAHDVLREARIMRDLADTDVPVPDVLGTCDDRKVTGAPFYVMRFVDGLVLRSVDDMRASMPIERRADACRRLVETLVAIHGVDLDESGLADLGKREGYVERQLRRWRTQWEAAGSPHAPEMADLHDDLVASMPASADRPATLVHGDFRFDNSVIGHDGEVRAVLDWELSTLGDPLADLAITMAAWSGPGEPMTFGVEGPTSAEGCLDRDDAIAHYATASGRDVADVDWYLAWANWRIACILSGVHARNVQGGGGRGTHSAETYFDEMVIRAANARRSLETVRPH